MRNEDDTYLTLGVLADILEVLSGKSGKITLAELATTLIWHRCVCEKVPCVVA